MVIVGLILAVFAMLLTISVQKSYKDETGVNAPSRRTMKYLRRRAREKGISEQEAHDQWLERKQKAVARAAPPATPRPADEAANIPSDTRPYQVVCSGIEGNEASFEFHCRKCGGCIMQVDDAAIGGEVQGVWPAFRDRRGTAEERSGIRG